MNASHRVDTLAHALDRLDSTGPEYATQFVNALLETARHVHASDVHLQPTQEGVELRWRLDGVLQQIGTFPKGMTADPVVRLKVLAGLLTYRHDIPQEGRIRDVGEGIEMRVSTFPTLGGERAVVRLFSADAQRPLLDDLGLPNDVLDRWHQMLSETSGALLITGPAGSGKTTSAYACLRQIVRDSQGGRCVVSLEDPIEVSVPGVAQSQANEAAGLTLASGLKSLLRQDPEVILVGEMRDRDTAEVAFQAALTGQLLITTFHANSAAGSISRLSDMGIEPYVLRSGILGILSQRLVRRLCTCATPGNKESQSLGLQVQQFWEAGACDRCHGTGYLGRMVLAEILVPERSDLGRAILSRSDTAQLEILAVQSGMITQWHRALDAVEQGQTTPAEIRRVLGFSDSKSVRSR